MDLHQCLRTFTVVVEQSSFNQAAKRLYRSPSQISKEISWLEDYLSCTLLNRTTRALHITEAGQHCYRFAKQLLSDVDGFKQGLGRQHDGMVGPLRVSVPVGFGQRRLAAALSDFVVRHPDIQLQVDFTNRMVDLVNEDVDVAVRTEAGVFGSMVAHKIAQVTRCVFASPDYLEQHGVPERPEDLMHHKLITNTDLLHVARWYFGNNDPIVVANPRYCCNSIDGMIDAAIKGIGCVYLPRYHIADHIIKQSLLVEVLKPFQNNPVPIYICHIKKPYVAKRVTTFIAEMIQACES